MEMVVLDFETTGSVPGYANEPWQVGGVSLRFEALESMELWESFIQVDSTRPFNPYAPGRHAQLRKELECAPSMTELLGWIYPRLKGRVLVAHNVGTERKMLREMAPMHRFGPWLDTLKLARFGWPNEPSYALEKLVVRLDLLPELEQRCPGREPHDALFDAVASALLLRTLLRQPGWNAFSLEDLLHLSGSK